MADYSRGVSECAGGVPRAAGLLAGLAAQPADPLLALIAAFRADPRATKIDLGVGVYRDAAGATPVMAAVKQAERHLADAQTSKGYLGPEGDIGFVEALMPVLLGDLSLGDRLTGLQTPGGTGALRLAAEAIARARPGARIHVGTPTWPNHAAIFTICGLHVVPHRHFDVASQRLCFDEVATALAAAAPGDVVLLHGCCHNPTGADFSLDQWREITRLVQERHLLPLIDIAYQGLGAGLEADAAGPRHLLGAVEEALVAYSCDKNFALYRERTGALYALTGHARTTTAVRSNLFELARVNWSMPPDHGAAVARIVLETPALTALWRAELDGMGARIRALRQALAAAEPSLAALSVQQGLFSTLALSPAQVAWLREARGIYMAGSGRINIAGLTEAQVPALVDALTAVREAVA